MFEGITTVEELEKARRREAKRTHPDRSQRNELFVEMMASYEKAKVRIETNAIRVVPPCVPHCEAPTYSPPPSYVPPKARSEMSETAKWVITFTISIFAGIAFTFFVCS